MEQLKKGQQVVIKSAKLSGTVIGPRTADFGTEYEGAFYKVQIPEQTLWCSREDLEPWPVPNPKLTRWSKEWRTELERFAGLLEKWKANPNDLDNFREISESGTRLGFFIPIEE